MDPTLLTELRNKLSDDLDLVSVLVGKFNSLEGRIDELQKKNSNLGDVAKHMNHALRMISQVQPTEEGARMAAGIAAEAISAVGLD